jgi:hypothetical protein
MERESNFSKAFSSPLATDRSNSAAKATQLIDSDVEWHGMRNKA